VEIDALSTFGRSVKRPLLNIWFSVSLSCCVMLVRVVIHDLS
jgi:hypothetical protein